MDSATLAATSAPAAMLIPSPAAEAFAAKVRAPRDPATLTAGELTKAIAKAEAVSSALCSEFIATGRGHERHSDICAKSDPLSLRHVANSETLRALLSERQERRTYHGSDRPIRRNVSN